MPELVETSGLAVALGLRDRAHPSRGSAYSPKGLAAGVPLLVHPLGNGRYLLVYGRIWTNATQGTEPQFYTAHRETNVPHWYVWDERSGGVSPVKSPGADGATIPLPPGWESAELVGASAEQERVLLLLDRDGDALIQELTLPRALPGDTQGAQKLRHHVLTPVTMLTSPGVTRAVSFTAGIYVRQTRIYVFGKDERNRVYLAYLPRTSGAAWSFRSDDGWVQYPAEKEDPVHAAMLALAGAVALPHLTRRDPNGEVPGQPLPITTSGRVSATTLPTGARVLATRRTDVTGTDTSVLTLLNGWHRGAGRVLVTIELGTEGVDYPTGGEARFLSGLQAHPENPALVPGGGLRLAVPYASGHLNGVGGDVGKAIETRWGVAGI